ncbi:aminopeptidase 2 [Oxobacter pfennigii]|uniref:Aminopeptidase 2 n=1 Tax=Oxobacter pfennigii TaxID=36849 RepID=A0A0P8WA19_9CLOT|nr:aminopeptidase [Oxobacter pfennigii]KPU45460.1 aminopeptidase 2 [Oxobacter pfennigii]
MKDIRIEKMAKVLVNYSMKINKGNLFLIDGKYMSMPLIKEVYLEALKVGANPMVRIAPEGIEEVFYKSACEEQLNFANPISLYEAEKIDALLSIWGEYNTREKTGINPELMKRRRKAREKEINVLNDRIDKGEIKWCGTQFPTYADAQEASMSLDEYEDFVFGACMLNYDDPTAQWKKIKESQDKIIKWLSGKSEFHVKAEDTDLRLRTDKRRWVNCCGQQNFPDGEVFSSPVEHSINGHIRFSFPGIYNGREIEDIRLTFKDGKVVDASAKVGQDLLLALLDTDEGSRYVGEFAIGTNYEIKRFTKNMLFDEKIGGTIHLAIGRGFEESDSKNNSLIHWDMLCDMRKGGEVYADGELFYKDGKLLI